MNGCLQTIVGLRNGAVCCKEISSVVRASVGVGTRVGMNGVVVSTMDVRL